MSIKTQVNFSIEGLSEIDASLREMTKATARNVGRRALRAAGKVIAETASQLAPDDPATGDPDLHRSIVVSSRLKDRRGEREFHLQMRADGNRQAAVDALIGARRTQSTEGILMMFVGPTGRPLKYAHLQEFGTVNHAAQPYMTPAWEREKENALRLVSVNLKAEIAKAAARAKRKALKASAGGKK